MSDTITNVVQAYERGYARGRRDAATMLRKVVERHSKHRFNTDVPEVELTDLIEVLESDGIPKLGGDQEPQGSDPHE